VGLSVPVLVMRDTTERPEGIDVGGARLVGTAYDTIAGAVGERLRAPHDHRRPSVPCPYGDGRAADRIVSILLSRAGVDVELLPAVESTTTSV
jgi:UDP-N-acetylglucosamine 2-epimerase (non-hydrolysing)